MTTQDVLDLRERYLARCAPARWAGGGLDPETETWARSAATALAVSRVRDERWAQAESADRERSEAERAERAEQAGLRSVRLWFSAIDLVLRMAGMAIVSFIIFLSEMVVFLFWIPAYVAWLVARLYANDWRPGALSTVDQYLGGILIAAVMLVLYLVVASLDWGRRESAWSGSWHWSAEDSQKAELAAVEATLVRMWAGTVPTDLPPVPSLPVVLAEDRVAQTRVQLLGEELFTNTWEHYDKAGPHPGSGDGWADEFRDGSSPITEPVHAESASTELRDRYLGQAFCAGDEAMAGGLITTIDHAEWLRRAAPVWAVAQARSDLWNAAAETPLPGSAGDGPPRLLRRGDDGDTERRTVSAWTILRVIVAGAVLVVALLIVGLVLWFGVPALLRQESFPWVPVLVASVPFYWLGSVVAVAAFMTVKSPSRGRRPTPGQVLSVGWLEGFSVRRDLEALVDSCTELVTAGAVPGAALPAIPEPTDIDRFEDDRWASAQQSVLLREDPLFLGVPAEDPEGGAAGEQSSGDEDRGAGTAENGGLRRPGGRVSGDQRAGSSASEVSEILAAELVSPAPAGTYERALSIPQPASPPDVSQQWSVVLLRQMRDRYVQIHAVAAAQGRVTADEQTDWLERAIPVIELAITRDELWTSAEPVDPPAASEAADAGRRGLVAWTRAAVGALLPGVGADPGPAWADPARWYADPKTRSAMAEVVAVFGGLVGGSGAPRSGLPDIPEPTVRDRPGPDAGVSGGQRGLLATDPVFGAHWLRLLDPGTGAAQPAPPGTR